MYVNLWLKQQPMEQEQCGGLLSGLPLAVWGPALPPQAVQPRLDAGTRCLIHILLVRPVVSCGRARVLGGPWNTSVCTAPSRLRAALWKDSANLAMRPLCPPTRFVFPGSVEVGAASPSLSPLLRL